MKELQIHELRTAVASAGYDRFIYEYGNQNGALEEGSPSGMSYRLVFDRCLISVNPDAICFVSGKSYIRMKNITKITAEESSIGLVLTITCEADRIGPFRGIEFTYIIIAQNENL